MKLNTKNTSNPLKNPIVREIHQVYSYIDKMLTSNIQNSILGVLTLSEFTEGLPSPQTSEILIQKFQQHVKNIFQAYLEFRLKKIDEDNFNKNVSQSRYMLISFINSNGLPQDKKDICFELANVISNIFNYYTKSLWIEKMKKIISKIEHLYKAPLSCLFLDYFSPEEYFFLDKFVDISLFNYDLDPEVQCNALISLLKSYYLFSPLMDDRFISAIFTPSSLLLHPFALTTFYKEEIKSKSGKIQEKIPEKNIRKTIFSTNDILANIELGEDMLQHASQEAVKSIKELFVKLGILNDAFAKEIDEKIPILLKAIRNKKDQKVNIVLGSEDLKQQKGGSLDIDDRHKTGIDKLTQLNEKIKDIKKDILQFLSNKFENVPAVIKEKLKPTLDEVNEILKNAIDGHPAFSEENIKTTKVLKCKVNFFTKKRERLISKKLDANESTFKQILKDYAQIIIKNLNYDSVQDKFNLSFYDFMSGILFPFHTTGQATMEDLVKLDEFIISKITTDIREPVRFVFFSARGKSYFENKYNWVIIHNYFTVNQSERKEKIKEIAQAIARAIIKVYPDIVENYKDYVLNNLRENNTDPQKIEIFESKAKAYFIQHYSYFVTERYFNKGNISEQLANHNIYSYFANVYGQKTD